MRVLFLDIDGVLNSASYRKSAPSTGDIDVDFRDLARRLPTLLDAWCVRRVQSICDDTGAVIVLSTSWRVLGLDVVRPILRDAGLTADVVDKIGREGDGRRSRGEAIRQWLSYRPEVTRHVVVDDRTLEQGITGDCVVRTNSDVGITDHDAERAIAILRGAVALVGWDANGAPETSFPEGLAPMFGALPTNVGPAASQPPGAVIDRLGGTTDG